MIGHMRRGGFMMIMVLIGAGRHTVGGNLYGRLVVALRGGTSGGVTIVDGGAITNGLGRVGLSC